jgi:co-chaperonin GroES (HSP10)
MHRVQGTITPLKKRVLVSHMHFGDVKTKGGIILMDDDGTAAGTHPRWAKVYAIGKDQNDVKVGEWVMVAHGRWTRQIILEDNNGDEFDVRMIDENDILLTSPEEPEANTITAPYKK